MYVFNIHAHLKLQAATWTNVCTYLLLCDPNIWPSKKLVNFIQQQKKVFSFNNLNATQTK